MNHKSNNFKSGYISFVGSPNSGKSTLFNYLLKNNTAIVSHKPQTTRDKIVGVLTDKNSEIVLVDTPGIHKQHNQLGKIMNKKATSATKGVDVICLLVAADKKMTANDHHIIRMIKERDCPVILLLTKVDLVNKEQLFLKINQWKDVLTFKEIIPISVVSEINIDLLKEKMIENLTDIEPINYQPSNINNEKLMTIKEEIRQKIILLAQQELPYSLAISITDFTDKKKFIDISANIIVERNSQKKIIIGHQGNMIKKIGIESRIALEKKFNKKIMLRLFAKVIVDWRNNPRALKDLGYQ